QYATWLLNDTAITGGSNLGTPGSGWSLVGASGNAPPPPSSQGAAPKMLSASMAAPTPSSATPVTDPHHQDVSALLAKLATQGQPGHNVGHGLHVFDHVNGDWHLG